MKYERPIKTKLASHVDKGGKWTASSAIWRKLKKGTNNVLFYLFFIHYNHIRYFEEYICRKVWQWNI